MLFQVSSGNPSKLDYEDESDSEPHLENNKRTTVLPVEFGGSFGNIVLALLLPILVIVAKIALKAVMNTIHFSNFYVINSDFLFRKEF